jgi:hypothetical protein
MLQILNTKQQTDNEYLQENLKDMEIKEQTNEKDGDLNFCKAVL